MAQSTAASPFYSAALRGLVRYRWLVLVVWSVAQWWVVRDHTGDWAFFNGAAREVFGATIGHDHLAGGIHTYAHDPVQFGPPPILCAAFANLFGGTARAVFDSMIMALCVPMLWLLEDTARRCGVTADRARTFTVLTGLLLIQVWGILAFGASHMDDALVLFGAIAVLNLMARDRTTAAAVVAGTAAAAKPWGVVVLGLMFVPAVPRPGRAFGVAAGVLLLWWVPFLLDPHTITTAGDVRIAVEHDGILHLLDPGAVLTPRWVRPTQLIVGTALTALVARRNPWGALLIGIAVRLMIDPGGYDYYWTGLLIAAMAYDQVSDNRWPVTTVLAWLVSRNLFAIADPELHAVLSLVGVLGCVGMVLRPIIRDLRGSVASPAVPIVHHRGGTITITR